MPDDKLVRSGGDWLRALPAWLRPAHLPRPARQSIAVASAVFLVDLVAPADFMVGVLYLVAMVLAGRTGSRRWLFGIGAASCGLTLLAGLIGAQAIEGTLPAVVWANRGLTVLALLGVLGVIDRGIIAQARESLLRREVDHRAKNVLAVVVALLRLAPRDDPGQFARMVEERVHAIARVHSLLADAHWEGTDLKALAQRELAPYALAAGRIRLEGPPVQVGAATAQPLGMFLHELATNSAKHGALSVPAGSVGLHWWLASATGELQIEWTETGGPPLPQPPQRSGFGTRLMGGLMRQIDGRAERAWHGDGLRCLITLPHGPGTRAA